MDDPPPFMSLGLAAVIANPSTFAPAAVFSIVNAISSAGPRSFERPLCDQVQPFAQSNPPHSSIPAFIVTAALNAAPAHAYTCLPVLCAALIASASVEKGFPFDPSPPADASA
jgi:hypothetical protein